jgi:hypothetical protein
MFLVVLCLTGSFAVRADSIPLDATRFRESTPQQSVEAAKDGVRIRLDMGTKRANWNQARWTMLPLETSLDLRDRDLLITVSTEKPRRDAGVYLAIMEADGSWYYRPWACDLTQPRNTGAVAPDAWEPAEWVAPFSPAGRTTDENPLPDLDNIRAIAIGCVNPLGVGVLDFTVHSLSTRPTTAAKAPATAEVHVTGAWIDINGTTHIPAGVFGSFNLPKDLPAKYRLAAVRNIHHSGLSGGPDFGPTPVTHMMINTIGDRVRPSPRLTHKNWQSAFEDYGTRFGKAAAASSRTVYAEFWNEPYLNWANNNRANFNPAFFDETKAEEGGPVHIKHDGEIAPHLRWTRNPDQPPWLWTDRKNWRRGRDARGRVWSVFAIPYKGMESIYGGAWQPQFHPPENVADGSTYRVDHKGESIELTAFTPWHIYDETQFTYWSGRGQLKFYIEPMLAFATAMKKEAPDAVFLAGWGNRMSEDHWAGWKQLYQPTLDAAPHLIDGMVDHNYGGDPTKMAANYEVLTAYGVNQHKKWFYGYNTECASATDPQAYAAAEGLNAGAAADLKKFQWISRKILHNLVYVPDKLRLLLHFGYGGGWFSDKGEGVSLTLLNNLRGRLIEVRCSDADVLVVASIDGTDPQNPRPDSMTPGPELVVAVLNNSRTPKTVRLDIDFPPGTTATGEILRTVDQNPGQSPVLKEDISPKVPGSARRTVKELVLASYGIATLTYPLSGTPADKPSVLRKQFFFPDILQEVAPGQPARGRIEVDPALLKQTQRVRLRLAAERLATAEGLVQINGREFVLPSCATPENTAWVRELDIPADLIKAGNELEFTTARDSDAGFLLCSASLILDATVGD